MQHKIMVKSDDPQIKRVVLPNGETALADVINAFEMGNKNYLVCWFPLTQIDASESSVYRFEEINGFIRLFEMESTEEFEAVSESFKNLSSELFDN